MNELGPRARALLAAAHGADDPAPGDALRVQRAVLVRIGSAGFGATVFSLSLQRAQAFFASSAPKLVALVAIAVTGHALYVREQRRAEPPSSRAQQVPIGKPALTSRAPSSEPTPLPAVAIVAELPLAPARQRAKSRPARAPVASGDLEAEMRWVRGADGALRAGNVAAAMALLDAHARDFPSGSLAEEREGLRIVAACQSGSDDGRRAAARFLERAPRSLLAGRLRGVCPSPAPTPE